ncbi:MAG: carboxylesterase family protein [Spirochaetales bacterium]|nr:carboxylesterase family protein [Spirochaetales bacterium]
MKTSRSLAAFAITAVLILTACTTARKDTPVPAPGSRWSGSPLVSTAYGAVLGHEDDADTFSWKGIPYAAPPAGNLRWRAPENPVPWTGVLEAKKGGSLCSQPSPLGKNAVTGSEDCLFLNIWRPATEEEGLPVYVWIHGGGNSIGGSDIVPDYRGYNLASRGKVVFVSINYRLGPFGWFSHPSLRTGSPGDELNDSGNFGTLDIIQALEWIQENILSFGGDPNRVTIAGESAGGFNVTSLLISPLARGLFHRAVSQSGGLRVSSREEGDKSAAEAVQRILEADGLTGDTMSDEELAAYLRSKSDKEILAAYDGGFGGMLGIPNIFSDGTVIPASGYAVFTDGSYPSKVPLILGSNADELRLFLTFSKEYRKTPDLFDLVSKIGSDNWKAEAVDAPAETLTSHPEQPPVFAYHFRWGTARDRDQSVMPGNWGFRLGATHSLDIPFFLGHDTFNGKLLGSLVYSRKNKPGREDLSEAMMDYLISFIHNGDPGVGRNREDLPRWQPWSNEPDGPKSLVFDADYEEAILFMTREVYTTEGILASYEGSVDPELFEEAKTRVITEEK